MTEHAPDIVALLDRTPMASRFGHALRAAIEAAVAELVSALRTHHMGTAEHSNRLAACCREVGDVLGLGADDLFELELVAILHDIGKLTVPATILDLARPLNAAERELVRAHTVRG